VTFEGDSPNNWLNEKTKLFIFPSFADCSNIKTTAFTNITDLYESEKFLAVKKAPGLSQKVCYPNNLERQNVNFALQNLTKKLLPP
jgi:hypothetical protein